MDRQYASLSARLTTETAAQQTFQERLTDAEGALARAQQLQIEREEAYGRAFDAIIAEQKVLEQLYRPLMARLASSPGTLQKLSFSVSRVADVAAWATEAEMVCSISERAGRFESRSAHRMRERRASRCVGRRQLHADANRDDCLPRQISGRPAPALSGGEI